MVAANSSNPNTIQTIDHTYFPLPSDPDQLTLADALMVIRDLDALREVVREEAN